jgi:serine/threonine protein kinase
MSQNVDEAKKSIRTFIRSNPQIATLLGDLTIETRVPPKEGGNALVYLASWGRGKTVVIKILAEDCSARQTQRYERFLTAFREMIQLSDSGVVVSAYTLGFIETENGKYPYMVMKQYPFTLKSWIRDNPIESLQDLMPVLQNLIQCLSLIHDHNIVHRDLKPENVFVAEDNKIVLADFDIAWFDPAHYERLVQTSAGDRLANFAFSAPEQFQRNPTPHQTMDLFALGQIVQWLVTGDTHRGTGRRQLATVDTSFAPIDPVIDALLQQDPSQRPQTTGDLQNMLNVALEPKSNYYNVWYALHEFGRLLAMMFPGKMRLVQIQDKSQIDTLMENLSQEVKKYEIWFHTMVDLVTLDLAVTEIRKLSDDVWLINSWECKIESIWINKSYSEHRDYILLICAPMPSFGMHSQALELEEAAWFMDRYITRGEYDDGFAEIDGKVVELKGRAEARIRATKRIFMFLATHAHDIVQGENEETVNQVIQNLLNQGEVEPHLLEPLRRLRMNAEVLAGI